MPIPLGVCRMGNGVLASEGEIEVTLGHDVGLYAALKQLVPVNQGEVQLLWFGLI